MSFRRSWPLLLAAFAAVVITALSSLADAPRHSSNLFVILRSKNADEAHYDARVSKDGALDPGDGVDGYFKNKGSDGSWSRADFTWIQKRGYGWETKPTGDGSQFLKLKAFPDRNMWIRKYDGRWRVETTIAGKQALLDHLYVATDESGIMPKVLYVDVFGEDATTRAKLTEHLVPK
jgi:Domain of unknown function (DUF4833)